MAPWKLLVLALAAAACGGRREAPDAGPPRDTIVIAVHGDAESMIPVLAGGSVENMLADNLFIALLQTDFDCELTFRPGIASSWEVLEDGRSVRVELRSDLVWSDGVPITAEDVIFTFAFVADPEVGSSLGSVPAGMLPEARPRQEDPTHLVFTFDGPRLPSAMLFQLAAVPILPRHALEGQARSKLKESTFNLAPVTSGAWKLATWERGSRIVLAPNEHFKVRERPPESIRRVILSIQSDPATTLMELKAGNVDLVDQVPISEVDGLAAAKPSLVFKTQGWRALDFLAWNGVDRAAFQRAAAGLGDSLKVDPRDLPRHPFFGDTLTRRALSEAIDVERILRDLLTSRERGMRFGRPAVGTYTPALCKLAEHGIEPVRHDPAAARRHLEAAGWRDTDGDGVMERNGKPFRFRVLVPSTNPRKKNVAQIVQANLKDIGVDAEPELLEPAAFLARQKNRDFDALIGSWAAALDPEPGAVWHSGPFRPLNVISYANPEVDGLIEQAQVATQEDLSRALHLRVQRTIYEDQPYTFLYWYDNVVAVDGRFAETHVNQISPVFDLFRWTVPADQVKYR